MMSSTWKRAFGAAALAACALSFTREAAAQTQCTTPGGPDVIVGDITGPQNYNAVGSLEALALGTYSCNMGDVWLNWFANTNQHPVIGGELYRFKLVNGAGRFEQIGLSWLKHGFFALSNNLCCSGCQGTDGTHLGVRCADPYTAQRNGTQSGLGPRYQVNAHTGFFNYPPHHTPSGGNTGRVEVDVANLEPTGGSTRYFANCQYVSPDDAAAGNQNNNSSHRGVTVTGSGSTWTFGFTGATQREIPAIKAWASCESGVTLNDIQIPGEGLVILGYKVTDLGNGMNHYEYALYNMNSDRSIRSFTIPIPSGTTVANVGFNDVTYRGNDGMGGTQNFSGADWAFTNTGTTLEWSTSTFAQDTNANALRWGTTYNFRFDSSAVPTPGTINLGTFKVAGNVPTTADVPGGPGAPGVSFCSGDGTLATFCPCLNFGGGGNGCANSQNASGANLASAGTAVPDTVVLTATGELPTALTIFLQGDSQNSNGVVFGDGLRCVAGDLRRLYVKSAVGGTVAAPTGGDPSITARSAALGAPIAPGSTRYYMTYYRDPSATFCPAPSGNTFNGTNGQIITW